MDDQKMSLLASIISLVSSIISIVATLTNNKRKK